MNKNKMYLQGKRFIMGTAAIWFSTWIYKVMHPKLVPTVKFEKCVSCSNEEGLNWNPPIDDENREKQQ